MAYAHSKGVLHRDLKPANIMVGAFGEVQVVDWGLAKVLSRGGVADEQRVRQSRMTVIETVRSGPGSSGSDSMVGSVMGTPAYMAPEQAQGEIEKLDERADVFSLGAILCEILTGQPPYDTAERERTVLQAAKAQLDGARERIEASQAEQTVKELCLSCLTPARDARPRNADEVARTLREHLNSVDQRARDAELSAAAERIKAQAARRAHRLSLALGGTVIAALLLAGGGYAWIQRERADRLAMTTAAIDAAQSESIELAGHGRYREALDAARRARGLAMQSEVGSTELERAGRLVAQAEQSLDAAEHEAELVAKDQALLAEIEQIRVEDVGALLGQDKGK